MKPLAWISFFVTCFDCVLGVLFLYECLWKDAAIMLLASLICTVFWSPEWNDYLKRR